MAEQQHGGAPRRKPGGRSDKGTEATGSVQELREALSHLVDPLGMVMLTRDRIEEALNDAVSRGRVTADDAQDLVASLIERGRRQTNDVIAELEQALAGKADRARRATGRGPAFPITSYDDLTAAQVQERLDGLSRADLRTLRDHERRHANRKTVLRAIDQRLN
jgi:hypothetical protein